MIFSRFFFFLEVLIYFNHDIVRVPIERARHVEPMKVVRNEGWDTFKDGSSSMGRPDTPDG